MTEIAELVYEIWRAAGRRSCLSSSIFIIIFLNSGEIILDLILTGYQPIRIFCSSDQDCKIYISLYRSGKIIIRHFGKVWMLTDHGQNLR